MGTEVLLQPGLLEAIEWTRLIPVQKHRSVHFVITDEIVDQLYGSALCFRLRQQGLSVHRIALPPGEQSKSFATYQRLVTDIFDRDLSRGSVIIGLGGGVINNIAGFAASTLHRGIGLIQVPTSLLSQLDAAVDFKQAINWDHGKNLIGCFHPATAVVIDPTVLITLPDRHLRNGLAEAIKHAITQNSDFLAYLDSYDGPITELSFLQRVIGTTLHLKLPLLESLEEEGYSEMLMQYGHAVGHALEHLSSSAVLHGEAVAIGMCVMSEVSRILEIGGDDFVDLSYRIISRYGLPTAVPASISDEEILQTIRRDKHYLPPSLRVALGSGIGNLWCKGGRYFYELNDEVLTHALRRNRESASGRRAAVAVW